MNFAILALWLAASDTTATIEGVLSVDLAKRAMIFEHTCSPLQETEDDDKDEDEAKDEEQKEHSQPCRNK